MLMGVEEEDTIRASVDGVELSETWVEEEWVGYEMEENKSLVAVMLGLADFSKKE